MKGIKGKLTGAFGLLMLFTNELSKYSGTKREALRSLVIPFALLPLGLWIATLYPPKGMETGYTNETIIIVSLAHFFISLIFGIVAVAGVATLLKVTEKFWLYFEASNWVSLAFFIVALPFTLAAIYEVFPRDEMDRILAILAMYGYVVTAAIIWKAFKTNWQLAGATSILTLFVNQETSHLLYAMMGIPIPW